jgi:hypothetical protein
MNSENFLCPNCGGPVEPLPGKTILPCPYCGSAVTIPVNLRLVSKPDETAHGTSSRLIYTSSRPTSSDDISDVLRQVEPLATNAVKAYGFWVLLRSLWRRVFPACAIVLMILCFLVCGLSIFVIFMSQRGG